MTSSEVSNHLKRKYVDGGIRQEWGSKRKKRVIILSDMLSEEIPWLGVSFFSPVPYITVEMTTALKNTLSMLFEIVASDASRWYHSEQLIDFLRSHIVPTSIIFWDINKLWVFQKIQHPNRFSNRNAKMSKNASREQRWGSKIRHIFFSNYVLV